MKRTRPIASGTRRVTGIMLLAITAFGWLVGQAQAHSAEATRCDVTVHGKAFIRTELFFGLSRPGGQVSEAQFQSFIDERVTPRFPAGLTVLDVRGQFRDAQGRMSAERSKLMILLVPRSDRAAGYRLEQVRAAYRQQFEQLSVLRVDEPVCVSF